MKPWTMKQFKRWETLDRWAGLSFAVLLFCASAWLFASGSIMSIVGASALLPIAFVFVWEALFEDRVIRGSRVTRIERLMAGTWLWFRRLALGSVAAIWLLVAALIAVEATSWKGYLGAGFMLLLAVMALWVAVLGGGRHDSWSDDLQIHQERKARYGWWL
jgi:hypothetical protein